MEPKFFVSASTSGAPFLRLALLAQGASRICREAVTDLSSPRRTEFFNRFAGNEFPN
jgi:hypothetical protein